jgi:hypothetical protein
MDIVFSDHSIPQKIRSSIFLAGPSPRGSDRDDWRHRAISLLESYHYDGTVFIPIPEDYFYGRKGFTECQDYMSQIDWEIYCRKIADKIVFWIPRDIKGGFPGFTTNIEFGEDLITKRIMYGRPDDADNIRYLDVRFKDQGDIHSSLESLLQSTVYELGSGVLREGVDINIPMNIWQSYVFSQWYRSFDTKYEGLERIDIKYAEFSSDHLCRALILNLHYKDPHVKTKIVKL